MRSLVLYLLLLLESLFGNLPEFVVDRDLAKYANYYIDVGRIYANEQRYKSAIWFYKRALKINPLSDTAFCNMGLAYYHTHQISKALNLCKKAIYSNPNNIELYKHTGMLYNDMQNYYKAYKAYSKALELNPKDIDSLIYIGDFYGVIKRDYNSSLKMYKRAVEADPNNSKIYYHIAYLYVDTKNYKKAIINLKKSLRLGLEDAEAYHSLFELELIENQEFDKDIEQSYISKFKDSKENFAIYEMLKIMRKIYKGEKVSVDDWIYRYKKVYIPNSWQFRLLESWISKVPKGIKRVQLTRALYIFKEHRRDTF